MIELAKSNSDIVAITAAMPDGTGLKEFAKEYKDRFFDVGIAEATCSYTCCRYGICRFKTSFCSVLNIFTKGLMIK